MSANSNGLMEPPAFLAGGNEDEATQAELKRIAEELNKPVDETKLRQQSGGGEYLFLKVYDIQALANFIFGYGGWSFEIIDKESGAEDGRGWASVHGRLTIHIWNCYYDDVGNGKATIGGEKVAEGFLASSALKNAASDAIKRVFRALGPRFGSELSSQTPANRQSGGRANSPNNRNARRGAPSPPPTNGASAAPSNGASAAGGDSICEGPDGTGCGGMIPGGKFDLCYNCKNSPETAWARHSLTCAFCGGNKGRGFNSCASCRNRNVSEIGPRAPQNEQPAGDAAPKMPW